MRRFQKPVRRMSFSSSNSNSRGLGFSFVPPTSVTTATTSIFSHLGSLNASANISGTHTVNSPIPNDKSVLPDDVLESCKCEFCKCYVSIGPVRMIDNKVACGRCHRESDGVRLVVVEALAKQFSFPCRYKDLGCNAILNWILMDKHEKVCDFREIRCTLTDCDWTGAKSLLKPHFDQKHSNAIINPNKGMEVNLAEKKTQNFLYATKNKAFLVLLTNNGETIDHQVQFFCTSLEACMYTYDICVYDIEKRLMFLNQKLQSFDDDTGLFNKGLLIEELRCVFVRADKINVSIQIKHTSTEPMKITMQSIECPVCLEPMLGNVYIGVCGHSFCERCKRSLKNCPCCRYDFFSGHRVNVNHEIRNYALEGVIKKLNLEL